VTQSSALGQELKASSSTERPKWIAEPPQGYQNDYFVGEGESTVSLPEASKDGVDNAIRNYLRTKSFEARSQFSQKTIQNGEDIQKKVVDELVTNGSSVTIKGMVQVETYYETWNEFGKIVHHYWVLVRVPKQKGFLEPPTRMSPLWRSVLLPGWGQFYKGQNTKGYIISISEVLLIPAGFILQSLKNTADVDVQNSRTQVLRDYYVDQANTYYNISISCFIAAAAMYIFNILDATISQGEKVYVEVLPDSHLKSALVEHTQTTLRLSVRF
jgi:hypothetical protein